MTLILKYLKQIWLSMLALLFLTVITTVATTARPLVVAGIINLTLGQIGYSNSLAVIESNSNVDANVFDLNQVGSLITDFFFSYSGIDNGIEGALPYFIVVLLILSILAGTLRYAGSVFNALLRSEIIRRMRSDFVNALLGLSLTFFNNKKSGELISRTLEDSKTVGQGIVSVTHRILHSFLVTSVYFIFLINTSSNLTLGITAIVLAHYLITALLKNPVKKYEKRNLEATASLTASLQEVFSNIKLIQSYPKSKFSTNNLKDNISGASRALFHNQVVGGMEPDLRYILDGLAEGLILVIAVYQLFAGVISIEGFLLYMYVARLVLGPINEFSTYFVWLQKIYASSFRIKEYYKLESDIEEGDRIKDSFETEISIDNISFAYKDEIIIKKFSLTINKDEVIAIVGKSGSGKSTLIDLILRFYDPLSGKIMIDGSDIREFTTDSYRDLFGIVSQEVFLLNETIENNIRYGRNISKEVLIEASITANAHGFISSLPNGYRTNIGDRGVKLSGGQRQRLSIARAIVDNPYILVLDEATSSLDAESERKVQAGIEKALKSRTAIVVAHRLSTIKNADKIVVIHNGCIEAIGIHEDLLESSVTYKQLHQIR